MNNLDMLIKMAFENADCYIPYEEKSKVHHFFSNRHKRNIERITNDFFPVKEPTFANCSATATRRIRTAFVCTLIAISMLLAGFIGYRIIAGLHVNEYNGYVLLTPTDAPRFIDAPMKKFKIKGVDSSQYTIQTLIDHNMTKLQVFINKKTGEQVAITQIFASAQSVIRIDGYDTPLTETKIGDKKFLHWGSKDGSYTYINADTNYTITYSGSHKDELVQFINATVIE